MRTVLTIGIYGFSAATFTDALHSAGADLVLDVRQRRGVRGSEYAWANSARLQQLLKDNGIGYRHYPELAPTTELRQLQYTADDQAGVGKRSRSELDPEYVRRYNSEILDQVDLAQLMARLPNPSTAAFLCVEKDAHACHRHLVTARFEQLGIPVTHL